MSTTPTLNLVTDLIDEVNFAMKEQGVTRFELAERMSRDGISITPGRVAQMLSGGEDLTVTALAHIAAALDREWLNVLMVR